MREGERCGAGTTDQRPAVADQATTFDGAHRVGWLSYMESNLDVAQRTQRRVIRRLIPYLMLVYLLAYVDRANLSVAKLQMQGELGFDDSVIGFGAGIFFFGYLFLEIPGTLIVERWSARRWIARIMISWGLIAALTGFIGTRFFGHLPLLSQFYGMRFLLGAAEAGFFPGVIVYFSHWFRFEDRSRAKAFFMVTQPLSMLLGVPLSRWIMSLVHWGGLSGWRWLFVLEGLPSVVMGVVTLFYLTDRPEDARWLPDDEKQWLMDQLKREEREKIAAGRVRISSALRQPQTLLLILIYFLIVAANQGFVFFYPSIVEALTGLAPEHRTLVMTLPYLFGVFGILLFGLSAYRRKEHRWHTALPMLINGMSLVLAVQLQNHVLLAIALFCLVGTTLLAYLRLFGHGPRPSWGNLRRLLPSVRLIPWAIWEGLQVPISLGICAPEPGIFRPGFGGWRPVRWRRVCWRWLFAFRGERLTGTA